MAQLVYMPLRNYYSFLKYIIGKIVIFQKLYVLERNLDTFTDEMIGCLGLAVKYSGKKGMVGW